MPHTPGCPIQTSRFRLRPHSLSRSPAYPTRVQPRRPTYAPSPAMHLHMTALRTAAAAPAARLALPRAAAGRSRAQRVRSATIDTDVARTTVADQAHGELGGRRSRAAPRPACPYPAATRKRAVRMIWLPPCRPAGWPRCRPLPAQARIKGAWLARAPPPSPGCSPGRLRGEAPPIPSRRMGRRPGPLTPVIPPPFTEAQLRNPGTSRCAVQLG
jgi:hypothetical protein